MGTEALAGAERGWLSRAWQFLREEVPAELRKVTWPTPPEIRRATLVIVVFVSLLGLLIGLMDIVFRMIFVDLVASLF